LCYGFYYYFFLLTTHTLYTLILGTVLECFEGFHGRVTAHQYYKNREHKYTLTRSEKMICSIKMFILVFMVYLLILLFGNNENVHRRNKKVN